MSPTPALVWATAAAGTALAGLGDVVHQDGLRDLGIVVVAGSLALLVAKRVVAWLLDRAIRQWEIVEGIPAAIAEMQTKITGDFAEARLAMQTIGSNLATHTAADLEWKAGSHERHEALQERIAALEGRVGWQVRSRDETKV